MITVQNGKLPELQNTALWVTPLNETTVELRTQEVFEALRAQIAAMPATRRSTLERVYVGRTEVLDMEDMEAWLERYFRRESLTLQLSQKNSAWVLTLAEDAK